MLGVPVGQSLQKLVPEPASTPNSGAVAEPVTPTVETPAEPAAPTQAPAPAAATPSSDGYPTGFVDKLVNSCAQGGKLTRSQCRCWFGLLENAYTFPQLERLIRQAQGGSIPPKPVALLRACLNS
jgi:hypothetical protein